MSTAEPLAAAPDLFQVQILRIKNAIFARFPRDKTKNILLLEKALADAEQHHEGQYRKSGEPVILHPLRVALLATESGLDMEAVIIALLHDIIEDTEVTKAEVRERYGNGVAEAVDGLTKVAKSQRQPTGAGAMETYRKLLSSTVRDIRTLQVKIFDRLDNMRDLGFLRRDRQRRISVETLTVYVPMAQRMGMTEISKELTALAFRYLYPKRFKATLAHLKACIDAERPTAEARANVLRSALSEFDLMRFRIQPIFAHAADFIVDKELPETALRGYAVTVPLPRDCYMCMGALHIKYRVVPQSIKDYISNPKPNLYQALESHIFVGAEPVSIWILSEDMEAVNRSGILANWNKSPEELAKYYKSYVELLDVFDVEEDLRMEDVLRHAQLETLQTFTPRGKLLTFPHEAAVLDFAFAVHTDLGLRCTGAIMNGKAVGPLDLLVDGAMVEIRTAAEEQATTEWLEHVKTTRSRLAIRRYLRSQALARVEELGRRLWSVELERMQKLLGHAVDEAAMARALAADGLDQPHFYQQVGNGSIEIRPYLVRHELLSPEDAKRLDGQEQSLMQRYLRPMFRAPDPHLRIPGSGTTFIHPGDCCGPLQGDAIVGVRGQDGLTIHRTSCPRLAGISQDSLINVGWEDVPQKTPYHLRIVAKDRMGLIYKIGKVMRDLKVGIQDMHTDTERDTDGLAEIDVVLEPITAKTYQKVVSRLRGIREVVKLIDGRTFWISQALG